MVLCRLLHHPMVVHGSLGVRFYAAAPLVASSGFRIGSM